MTATWIASRFVGFGQGSIHAAVTYHRELAERQAEEQLSLLPAARVSDPPTSHRAAETMRAGNSAIVQAIRREVHLHGPATAFEIAVRVEQAEPGRWDEGSIRTACKRAGLVKLQHEGESPRGIRCCIYAMPHGEVGVKVAEERL